MALKLAKICGLQKNSTQGSPGGEKNFVKGDFFFVFDSICPPKIFRLITPLVTLRLIFDRSRTIFRTLLPHDCGARTSGSRNRTFASDGMAKRWSKMIFYWQLVPINSHRVISFLTNRSLITRTGKASTGGSKIVPKFNFQKQANGRKKWFQYAFRTPGLNSIINWVLFCARKLSSCTVLL